MAKSETVPSIVVHSGNTNGVTEMEQQQRQTSRLSRLAKQEEFDLEENYSPSPVTIHIEDGGLGTDDNSEANCNWVEGDLDAEDSDGELSPVGNENLSANGTELAPDGNCGTRKGDKNSRSSHQRLKLVRSQAVRDDTSPEPDLEALRDSNMLTVTNVSTFTAQSHTQSKSCNKHQPLGKQGSSQGSVDDSSPTLSRDSSTETYTDSTGIDLQLFIAETLHKSQKDRIMLLKIEQELVTLVRDNKCQSYRFPHMCSYNRMLVHRAAAFFGLDHNVDKNGTSVIVNKTKNTRLPDVRFKDHIRDELVPDEPKKLILKRDSASFEDGKELKGIVYQSDLSHKSPERQSSTDSRRSKSFEEREEEYEKARRRIFNKDEGYVESPFSRSQDGTLSSSRRSSQEDLRWAGEPRPWSSTDSDSSGWKAGGSFESEGATQNGGKNFSVLIKSESENKETLLLPCSGGARPAVTKASSFGGISVLSRENGKASSQRLTKAESFNATPTCTGTAKETEAALEPVAVCATSPADANCSVTSVQELSPAPLPLLRPTPPLPPLPPAQMSEQPLPVQSPVQQVSSQQTCWEAAGKEISKTPSSNGKTPPLWQVPMVDSLPAGSVIINPSSVAPYFSPENVMYRGNKNVMTAPTQAFMVTPLQSFPPSPQLSLDSPISTSSNPSPPSVQQQQSPISAYHPAVVYIPCVTSQQIPAVLTPQPVHQHNPNQQLHAYIEQRGINQNGSSTNDLTIQMSSLNLLSQGMGPPSIQQPMPSVELAKVPTSQAYAFSAMKVPGYINQAVHPPQQMQVPVYYVQQMPAGGQNVRYYCPSGPMIPSSMVVSTAPTGIDLSKKQEMLVAEPRATSQLPQQVNSHISGQQLIPPGYSLLTFAQNVDNLGLSAMPYFSYTVPSQPGVSNPAFPSHNTNNSGVPLLAQPPHPPQSASSHLTSNFGNHQHPSYSNIRPHTPPAPPQCNPFLSYAFYSPQQQQQQNQQQSGHFAPSFVAGGFQVIRPNIPPPSPAVIPNPQFPTPPPTLPHHGKGQYTLQFGKDADNSFVESQNVAAGACSNSHDQKCPRIPSIHLGQPPVRVPTALPMYRHGLSLVQDVRLLGHPLHHQLSPLLFQQQRPLCRFTHPHSALANMPHHQQQHQRVPKLRRQRSKGVAGGTRNSISGGNHLLEVDGLPEGMKRSDIERYLELVTHHGAKIQFHAADGSSMAQGGDFVVNSCRYRVVAAFDSDSAAQNALLNIKTVKFQLRRSYNKSIS